MPQQKHSDKGMDYKYPVGGSTLFSNGRIDDEEEIDELRANIRSLMEAISNREKELAAAHGKIEFYKSQISKLESQLKKARKQISKSQQTVKEQQAQLGANVSNIAQLEDQLANSDNYNDWELVD